MNPAATSPWWVAPAVIAAIITGVIAVISLIANGRRARADRQRELFGAAFGDIARYCEFPFIVRRRRHDLPEEERMRISTELSEVQSKLNHNRAILRVEAPRVARAYAALVLGTREVAGESIRQGWDLTPITADTEVHVTDVDLSDIKPLEDAYLTAVADHLALAPWQLRAAGRWLARTGSRLLPRRSGVARAGRGAARRCGIRHAGGLIRERGVERRDSLIRADIHQRLGGDLCRARLRHACRRPPRHRRIGQGDPRQVRRRHRR